jgi:hypothetical protein
MRFIMHEYIVIWRYIKSFFVCSMFQFRIISVNIKRAFWNTTCLSNFPSLLRSVSLPRRSLSRRKAYLTSPDVATQKPENRKFRMLHQTFMCYIYIM